MADTNLVITEGTPTYLVLTGAFDYQSWAASLNEYDSDIDAYDDGIDIGFFYMTSDQHVSLPGGVVKQVRANSI